MGERIFRFVLGFCLLFALSVGGALAASGQGGYRVGAGDVLSVSVWKAEELTRQVVVLPDGTISFPLIGRVSAEGKQLEELQLIISERLAKFVPDPNLSLEVVQVNSLMVYVIGQVNRPGRFVLTDNIDVLQALALAGGLNAYANSGNIKVFRKGKKGTRIFKFNYNAVSKGKDLKQNISLVRGDVIVVR
jgi:polysaccharide export outer membrane protein